MKIILSILLVFTAVSLQAQEKNEAERRIKKSEVPSVVMEWFKDVYEQSKKVKWYYQTDGDKSVYEAKLIHQNQLHSVEISPDGQTVNIEILIDFNEIESNAKTQIESYFEANYSKVNVKKTQIQYLGDRDDLEDFIDEAEWSEDIKINYEIEFHGKNDQDDQLWEGLFNASGNIVELRKINLKATDNLDY